MNSNTYFRFQKLFKANEKLLATSSSEDIAAYKADDKLRDSIFSKICVASDSSKRLLFLRKIVVLNGTQMGLVYVYDVNKLFYFYKEKNSPVVVGEGAGTYPDLVKVFNIVKNDFYKKSNELKEHFEKKNFGDVPFLQLAFVDMSHSDKGDSLVEFSFGHLDNEFDAAFAI